MTSRKMVIYSLEARMRGLRSKMEPRWETTTSSIFAAGLHLSRTMFFVSLDTDRFPEIHRSTPVSCCHLVGSYAIAAKGVQSSSPRMLHVNQNRCFDLQCCF